MTNKIDKAVDNLWMTTDDSKSFVISPPPASKLINKGNVFAEGSKVSGVIVYFIPKDNKGKVTGKPVRLLRDGKGNFIDANVVQPYYQNILNNRSKWEDIGADDLISKAEKKLGIGETMASNASGAIKTTSGGWSTKSGGGMVYTNADGGNNAHDLSNSNGLDESVSGIYDENGKNLMTYTDPWALQYGINAVNFGNMRPYPKETGFERQPMIDLGADGSAKNSKKYGINAASFGNMRPYPKETGFERQPMIDLGADGSRRPYKNNKSKIYDLRLSSMPHGNPQREFDIQYGADAVNATQQLYTPEEIAALHASTGTKKPLLDWLQSDSAQNLFNSVTKVADTIKSIKGKGTTASTNNTNPTTVNTGSGNVPTYNNGGSLPVKKSSTTILGMSPVVFGLVSFGTIAVLSVVSIFVIRNVKAKKLAKSNISTVS